MNSKNFGQLQDFLSGNKKEADSKPPYLLAYRSSTFFICATVCIAIFTDILLYGIIVPVIPYALTTQVGVSDDSVQTWNAILLACYSVALLISSPLAGIYADHTSSRRWPLLLGLLALAGSTLMLCLGKTIALLIIGRVLQGVSAAIVWSVGLALLADTMGKNIGQAMGYISIAMSMGLLVSPAVGGAVYAAAGYYAVYYVAFGLIFLDILLRLLLIEKKVARQWIDDEESDPVQTIGAPPSIIASGKTAKHPKLRLLKSRRIIAANFGIVIQAGMMFAFDTVLPLFVKETFHWSSTAAGLIFFCIFIPGFISPVAGWLADRYGAKWPSFAGFVTTIPVLICMRFVTTDTIGHKVLLGALLAIMGVTLIFSNTPLMAEISYAIEAEEAKNPGIFGSKGVYGLGYGLFTTAFALGGSIGSLMAGFIMADKGWGTFTWAFAVWTAAGAVVVAFWVGGEPVSKSSAQSSQEQADAGTGGGILSPTAQ